MFAWRRPWDWGLLALLVAFALRGWLGPGCLASPRLEMVPELGIIWMAKQRILEGGLLTEWSQYEFAGFPLVRYLSYPLYDALALLSIITNASLEWLFKVTFIAAFVLSAITFYEFVYELNQERAPSLIAALAYALFPFHLHGAAEAWAHALFWALLPLLFLVYERSRRHPDVIPSRRHPDVILSEAKNLAPSRMTTQEGLKGLRSSQASGLRARDGLYLGLLLGLLPIVNSEHTLLTAPFWGLYVILRDASLLWQRRYTWRSLLGFWAIAGLVAVGLAAFFVLPGIIELEYVGIYLKHGAASFQSAELLRDYALPPTLIWRAIVKRLGADYALPRMPVIGSAFWSIAWYPGLVALGLALSGMWHARQDARTRITLVLLGLSLLFVMGSWLPWNPFPRLPFLGRLAAFRGLIFVGFFLSMLVGWGTQGLLRWQGERLAKSPLYTWGITVVIAALLFLDYLPATKALVTLPGYFPEDEIEAYRWMAAQGTGFRSWEYTTAHRDNYLRSYALQYDGGAHLWGYYDNGAPRHMWALHSWGDVPTALELGSVRYIVARPYRKQDVQLQEILARGYAQKAWDSASLSIWENPNWQPFVRVYQESALYLGDPEYRALDILPALVAQDVALVAGPSDYADGYSREEIVQFERVIVREPWCRDPTWAAEIERVVPGGVIKHAEVIRLAPTWSSERNGAASASVTWRRPGPERIEISVETAEPAVLMVSEAWYPNWHLYVDGREERVWRVNYAFLGARLEAGKHNLLFRYEKPWYVWLGYGITSLTLLAVVVMQTCDLPTLLRRIAHEGFCHFANL